MENKKRDEYIKSKIKKNFCMKKLIVSLLTIILTFSNTPSGYIEAAKTKKAAVDVKKYLELSPVKDDWQPVGGWSEPEIIYDNKTYDKRTIINSSSSANEEELDEVFTKGISKHGYNALSADQKKFYDRIDDCAKAFMLKNTDETNTYTAQYEDGSKENFYIAGEVQYNDINGMKSDEALQVYLAYDYDHPAYYWIANTYSMSDSCIKLLTYLEFGKASVRKVYNAQICSGVQRYAQIAESGTNQWEKARLLHDAICETVDYAYKSDGTTPETEKWAHSVIGVFDEDYSRVVCEGYADSYALVLNYMGIDNYYIVGTAGNGGSGGGGGHAWNLVSDGTNYVYADLTWDDLGTKGIRYVYFGMPKSDFEAASSHTAYKPGNTNDKWLYGLPDNITDDIGSSFYFRENMHADGNDYQSLEAKDGYNGYVFNNTDTVYINETALESFYNEAKTRSSKKGRIISLLSDSQYVIAMIERQVGISGHYTITYKNNTYYYAVNYLRDHRYVNPITDFKLSGESESTTTDNETYYITIDSMTPESSDDYIFVTSSDVNVAMVQNPHISAAGNEQIELQILNEGTTTITAKSSPGYGGTPVTRTYDLVVGKGVESDYTIAVNPSSLEMEWGTDTKLTGIKLPENTEDENITWQSSDENIATVTASGSVHAVSMGTVTIIAKAANGVTAGCIISIGAKDISNAQVGEIEQKYEYTGNPITPEMPTIFLDGIELQKDVDYTVDYTDCIEVGIASAVIQGKGNYKGTITRTYQIISKPTYTVVFHSNGGSAVASLTVTKDDLAIEPVAPARNGYDFAGWYSDESLNVKYDFAKAVTDNLDLYAKWILKNYTIQYDLVGGSLKEGEINPTTYTITSEDIILKNPIRSGFEFLGWTGTDLVSPKKDVVISKGSIGDRGYTANWQEIIIPVTSIVISTDYLEMEWGSRSTLTAKALPETATDSNIKWSSSDDLTATVDASGSIYALSMGSVTIEAQTVNGVTAGCIVHIGPKDMSKAEVEGIEPSYEHTGNKIVPERISVSLGGMILQNGIDYIVTCKNCTDVGTASAVIEGIGKYKGTITCEYQIVSESTIVAVTGVTLDKTTQELNGGSSSGSSGGRSSGSGSSGGRSSGSGSSGGRSSGSTGGGSSSSAGGSSGGGSTSANSSNNNSSQKSEISNSPVTSTSEQSGTTAESGTVDTIVAVQYVRPTEETALNISYQDKGVEYKISSSLNDTVSISDVSTDATKVMIPDTVTDPYTNRTYKVTKIEKNTFKNNPNLTEVVIGSNIKSIGANAFRNCKKLSTITIIGNSLKKSGKNAFQGLKKGVEIRIQAKNKKQYMKIKNLLKKSGVKNAVFRYRFQ